MNEPDQPQWPATVKRYCLNRDCPSFGRKYADRGRFICRSPIEQYTVAYCPDCKTNTIYNPPEKDLKPGEIRCKYCRRDNKEGRDNCYHCGAPLVHEEIAVISQNRFDLDDNV